MSPHDPSRPRVVALYLPHFYPEPALAAAWGPGFTDWQRVARAAALFPGHEQPRRPADLGYCDLRVPEVRRAQADLARAFGIDAFCYLHYWFGGRRLFERPFAEVLASGEPDFPFCLCWANEAWREPLLSQATAPASDRAHAAFLAEAFADPRYLRVAGRPVFLVRRPHDLTDPAATLTAIRAAAAERGVGDPWLLGADDEASAVGARALGFDGTLDWPEAGFAAAEAVPHRRGALRSALTHLVLRRRWLPRLAIATESRRRADARRRAVPADRLAVVPVGWDDSPGRGSEGTVVQGRSPRLFEEALAAALTRAEQAPEGERLVFVNAWNAWVQGASLEPDERFGRGYLAAVARARLRTPPPGERTAR